MKHRSFSLIILFLVLVLKVQLATSQIPGAQQKPTKWFTDGRFGMFIHWGLYSAAEGIWKGERFRHFNNYAEWIMYRNDIPPEEYIKLAERFEWDRIDVENWVLAAKDAGMKYIIITAKHHDGIALWKSNASEYSLPKLSGVDRDPIAELAAACKKHDIKLGFYYSHWIDWSHPYGWTHARELSGKMTAEEYDQYWQEKVVPQLRELLTNYSDIALLWFDMWIPHTTTVVERRQIDQVLALVKELQPNCLVNSRLGIPITEDGIDFETLGDNQFGTAYKGYPWETPGTIAHSWGYNALENQWKSTSQLLQALISNASLNGGYTLNIGPRADGSIPYESVTRLADFGGWLSKYGEAIYGSDGLELPVTQHDWGRITMRKTAEGGQNVYLNVFNWPLNGELVVSGITSAPAKAYVLGADDIPLSYRKKGPYLTIGVPAKSPDHYVSVIALEFDKDVELDKEVVAMSSFGGLSLAGKNLLRSEGEFSKVKFDGKRPEHLVIDEPTTLVWKIYVDEAGSYDLDISYSIQTGGEAALKVLSVGNDDIRSTIYHTGQTVMEPNEHNYTDKFIEKSLGSFKFDEVGYREINLEVIPVEGQIVQFNRIWVNN